MKSSYVNQKRPFTQDEFINPELAVRKHGLREALSIYRDLVEERYTDDYSQRGYPKDWKWRKFFVYHRDNGQCQGQNFTNRNGRRRHLLRLDLARPSEWTAHHIKHLEQGGNHALENLALLCWPCHHKEHPDKNY